MAKKYASLTTLQNLVDNIKALFVKKADFETTLLGYDTKGSAAAVQENLNVVSDTLDAHTDNTDIHVTTSNKSNWNTAYTHSQATHARTDATKVEDSATNGNIKINGTETNVYSHPNSGVTAGTYKSVTVNAQGHITGGSNPTTLSGFGITDGETKSDASAKLTEAKTYADNAATKVKNDLLNGAGTAYDTLKELGDLIDENVDAIDALETVAAGKADKTHTHAITDVSGLQSALDGKAASSHGTHVSYSTTAPVMDGTASVGSASTVARSDHKHPTDTSRASKTEFDTHNSDTTKHITSTERTNWNAAKSHADSAHAPSNAEKNQNAFSNITVGSTTVAADTATDTVTFVGSNVTITPDATNDKITFAVADGSTSGKGVVQLTNSTSSTSTTTAATPSSVKSAYDLANTAKTNAATAQSRADAAYTLANGKVDSLSDLGVTATAAELNYMDGVTSNVQTQLDSKLSTSGGTISGVITTTDGDAFNRNVTTGGTYYYGGTSFDDGAFLGLYGKDQSNYAGQFRLKADNGESFTYLEGMPDGQLRWNNKTVATLNSSGAIPIADGGTGARSSSGALANLGGVPLAGGEMTGALKLPKLSATSTDAYIGSMTVPFQQVYTKNVYIQDGKNDTVSYGDFRAQTTGTASVVGKAQLDVGNSTKTGTAGNARGIVRIYGTGAYYHQIQGDATSNRTLTLPNKTGTLATTDDVSTTKALTTAEYTELEQAGEINANTLYMLTDADDVSDNVVLTTEQSLTEEQKSQARMNIGVGEIIVDTLATLDIISTITDNDGSLAESDGTILVTRNDSIFLPKVDEENNGNILKVVDGKWTFDTIEIPDIPEINYPVTSVNGQTGDVNIEIPNSIPTPLAASIGQTIVVKSVDENGKPTEWECVNLPTDEHINALIDAKLEAIANGTY